MSPLWRSELAESCLSLAVTTSWFWGCSLHSPPCQGQSLFQRAPCPAPEIPEALETQPIRYVVMLIAQQDASPFCFDCCASGGTSGIL